MTHLLFKSYKVQSETVESKNWSYMQATQSLQLHFMISDIITICVHVMHSFNLNYGY